MPDALKVWYKEGVVCKSDKIIIKKKTILLYYNM